MKPLSLLVGTMETTHPPHPAPVSLDPREPAFLQINRDRVEYFVHFYFINITEKVPATNVCLR